MFEILSTFLDGVGSKSDQLNTKTYFYVNRSQK